MKLSGWVRDLGFRVSGFGFRDLGFRVWGLGSFLFKLDKLFIGRIHGPGSPWTSLISESIEVYLHLGMGLYMGNIGILEKNVETTV